MAITIHTYKLLKLFEKEIQNFGDILSLGRLDILISKADYKKFNVPKSDEKFVSKKFFFNFNFKSIDSIDASSFENANIIHDLNLPLKNYPKKYDTIIDFGTSEHIFNVFQNFKNISNLCKINGYILHCLPANNNCGHGFYQFSPEFFFQLYKEKNGYSNIEIYLINMLEKNKFYEVKNYTYKERLDFNSKVPLYIAVKAKKINETGFKNIFQSDYKSQWLNEKTNKVPNKKIFSRKYKNFKVSFKKKLSKIPYFGGYYQKKVEFKFYKKKKLFKKQIYKKKNYLEILNLFLILEKVFVCLSKNLVKKFFFLSRLAIIGYCFKCS